MQHAVSTERLSEIERLKKKSQVYTQLIVCFVVLIWSIVMLSLNVDPQNNTVYFSLVSSILSLFLPSPVQSAMSKQ
jgi:hypothetical protein